MLTLNTLNGAVLHKEVPFESGKSKM